MIHRRSTCYAMLMVLAAVFFISYCRPVGAQVARIDQRLIDAQERRIAAIARASRSAVSIFGPDSQGGGSGVVISADGYVLTNYHVVESNGPFMNCSLPDGNLYRAVIVGIDPTGDVALIKLLGRSDFPAATVADSDDVSVGDACFAVGNPFLLATNFQPSVSWGIVSGTHRYQYPAGTLLEYADCIQTDAAINPGNSGGPLFNENGDLIGINGRGSFEKRGRVNVGVGYAISINQIKHFLDHLKSGRLVDHATLGATVNSADDGAVRVDEILDSSDAWRKGLRYDDEIVSFGGRPIRTVNQFKNVLGIFPQGVCVPLTYRREGETVEVDVRLAGVHATGQLAEIIQGKPLGNGSRPIPPPKKAIPEETPKDMPSSPALPSRKAGTYDHMFVAREGFTNYYFNQLNQNRIWNAFEESCGDWASASASVRQRWRITASSEDGQPILMLLGDERSGMKMDGQAWALDPTIDFSKQLYPPRSGGLLVALHYWRKMLVDGPKKFGDVVYFGSQPTIGKGQEDALWETLVGTSGVIETWFQFSATSHRMVGLEMFPEIDSAPCQLKFSEYQQDNDLSVPQTISWTDLNRKIHTMTVKRIEFLVNGAQTADKVNVTGGQP